MGVCRRLATTTRDFGGTGRYDPCCTKCAAFFDQCIAEGGPQLTPEEFDRQWKGA